LKRTLDDSSHGAKKTPFFKMRLIFSL